MRTMACQEVRSQLLEYAEGDLNDPLHAALHDHIAACPHCQRELEDVQRLRSALLDEDHGPDPGAVFWDNFPDRVWRAYQRELSIASDPALRRRGSGALAIGRAAQWWATLGLRARFNLVLLAVLALGLGASGYMSYDLLQKNAREEVARNASMMIEAALAMRNYTISQIGPLLQDDPKAFHPQTVPAYAMTQVMSQLQKKYAGYSYKDATLNPTNPRNRAIGWEQDVVERFRGNPAQSEITGVRNTVDGPAYYLARPSRVVNRACLSCHTSPEQAPAAMVRMYGTTGGYGWKYDEVVGAQIVSVPMTLPIRNADRAFFMFMTFMTAVFVALFIILNIMMRVMISPRPRHPT